LPILCWKNKNGQDVKAFYTTIWKNNAQNKAYSAKKEPMNVRKPTDYSALFTALDTLMTADPLRINTNVAIGSDSLVLSENVQG